MRELSPIAILLGALIGVVFGAANAYIGLKVGMTVSASIPAAVISMAVLRGLLRRGTLHENNMVQTIGSVGESLAAGMIFTIPALFIFAQLDDRPEMAPSFLEMTIWGAVGGLLGVCFMIPLRRMLIVKERDTLPFPEGTACAEVLRAGQSGGVSARTVFWGLGVGGLYEFFRGLGFWAETARQRVGLLRTEFQLAVEPALLGVGYILGIRVAGYMLAGAVLGWFVIIPAIYFFGAQADTPIFPESAETPAAMSPDALWSRYLRYIGAGAVVLGGLVSLLRSLGTIGGSLFHVFGGRSTGERTDRDVPSVVLLLLVAGLATLMYVLPDVPGVVSEHLLNPLLKNIAVIACVIVFGFFFTTVSARLVGVVGSSSNPASGMTIATLLGASLVIVNLTHLDPVSMKIAIISVGALVCMCITLAGDSSQDLKTGYLVGATPWKQQVGQMIGVLTATAALAWVIDMIGSTYGFVRDAEHPNAVLAPQARLMHLLVQGVVDADLPWDLILIGVFCGLIVELLGIPSLPFAVGLYLPLGLSTPIMVGGALHWAVSGLRARRAAPAASAEPEAHGPGILAASGLVAGQGLMGVLFVGAAALIGGAFGDPRYVPPIYSEPAGAWAAYDTEADTWTLTRRDPDGERRWYYDEQEDAWRIGDAPPGARADEAPPRGELVVPHHFFAWLSQRIPGLDPEYGLRQLSIPPSAEHPASVGVDWYELLPLAPFGALTIWLGWVALRGRKDTMMPDR